MATNRGAEAMLPVANPTPSYWRSELHPLDSYRSTAELPETCDIAVIGAGFAGVSVVHHLSTTTTTTDPPPSILLLEARQACSGATGRNGGHVKVKTTTLIRTADTHGPAAAEALARVTAAHVSALADVARGDEALGAACEFERRASYDVFASEADARAAEAGLRRCRARGDAWARDRTWIAGRSAEEATGVRGARGAVDVGTCCSLWPYKFVMGLLERAVARNDRLNVQTETPVLGVEQERDGGKMIVIRTERGVVRAKKVVYATNAYTAALLPEYRGVITPYKGTAAHLAASDGRAPVPLHLSHTYNLDYGGGPELDKVDYLNPRPDGGIVVGGGKWLYQEKRDLWYDTVDDSTLMGPLMEAKYFDGYMQRNFAGWEDSGTETEKVWTGIQGETPDGFPHVGKVPKRQNQWILAGFNGGGNAFAFLCAKAVAEMALEDVALGDTSVDIPPFFETTQQRLGIHPESSLTMTLRMH